MQAGVWRRGEGKMNDSTGYLDNKGRSCHFTYADTEVPYICVVFHFHKETTALQVAIKPYSCMLTESSKQKCLCTKMCRIMSEFIVQEEVQITFRTSCTAAQALMPAQTRELEHTATESGKVPADADVPPFGDDHQNLLGSSVPGQRTHFCSASLTWENYDKMVSKYVGSLWLKVVLCAGGLLENLSLGLALWLTSALVCASQHSEVSGSFATAITERESTLDLVLPSQRLNHEVVRTAKERFFFHPGRVAKEVAISNNMLKT
ncbi:hypothetical protein Anapl_09182 [Anas platyrhynchos]|uniref:Uncharacterized protein n=1 Tax=Anas platyrhynchos TaxID=8839 RepID=R0KMV0_ANAPL|nr:hypothetical protein Anapl_09182 [Anas platyrhynchos]